MSTYFCKWQVFENFDFINSTAKKKEQEKLNEGSCSSFFCQDQVKDRQVTMEKLLLLIDSELKFCVYVIFWSRPKFAKFMKNIHTKISTLKGNSAMSNSPKSYMMKSSKIKNNILKTILPQWYSEWLKQWKYLSFMEMKVFDFIRRGKNLTKTTLREVWLWHLMLKNCKITGKIGFQFCKLTFLRVSDQVNSKFA